MVNTTMMDRVLEVDVPDMVAWCSLALSMPGCRQRSRRWAFFTRPIRSRCVSARWAGTWLPRAGGPRCLKYGTTKDYVLGLQVVLPSEPTKAGSGCNLSAPSSSCLRGG